MEISNLKIAALGLGCVFSVLASGQETTTDIDITKDARVYYIEGNPGAINANYETDANLHVLTGTNSGSPSTQRSFLEIDLSGLPANAVVISATLKVQALNTNQISGSNEVKLHKVDNSWDESTLTWGNQPTYSTDVSDPEIPAGGTGAKEVDLTAWVLEAQSSGSSVINFLLKMKTETAGEHRRMSFASSDHATSSYHPVLTVVYLENPIYVTCSKEETNAIYEIPWTDITVKLDDQFVAKSSTISYEILDQFNDVEVSKTSSNVTIEHIYIAIDGSALSLTAGEVYSLILFNENNEKRYLKFRK